MRGASEQVVREVLQEYPWMVEDMQEEVEGLLSLFTKGV